MNPDEMGILTFTSYLVLGMLTVAMFLAFYRLVRGPSLPDRVVALDLIVMLAVGYITVYDIATELAVFLDVAIVLALLSFLGTVAFARYVEKGATR
jgi:multicomponent Na+:H+ antiporter subunit F